jgi:hypothetical protein
MNFWNIALPVLTLLAPLAACLYFLLYGKARLETAPNWGAIVFGLVMLVSVVAVAHFEHPVRMEFLWPFSAEPSGYFEFTLQLHWPRYVWILFSSFALLVFSAFDGRASFVSEKEGRFKFVFLSAASFFSSLAFLSENIFLSLLFVEMTVFLLYSFGVLADEGGVNHERHSYFKRGGFLFLALLAILAVSFTKQFDLSSIMLLGAILYIMAFVFSRHSFRDWRYLPLGLLQAGAVFFLLGRVVAEDMSQELLLPLSTIFGVTVAIFSWFSLVSATALGSLFWTLFSFLGYLLFLRFSSGRHGDQFWGTYEAIALLSVLAMGGLLRFGRRAAGGGERAAAFACCGLLLAIVCGAFPGVDIAGARVATESPVKLVGLGLLTFLLSLIVGKALSLSFSKDNPEPEWQNFFPGALPALGVLILQAAAVVKMTDLYGESPFRMGAAYLLTNSHIVTAAAAIVFGLLAGALLGFNARFIGWIKPKETRMEELFPRIDPAILQWNLRAVEAPRRVADWAKRRSMESSSRGSVFLQDSDRALFGEKLYGGVRHYGNSLSVLTRYFHSGNVRAYIFWGAVITLLASAAFLLEGR